MNLQIRRAKHSDAEGIILSHMTSIQEICSKDYTPVEIAAWAGRKFKPSSWCQTIDRDYVWVIESKNEIYGFAHFAILNEEAGEILGLYLTPLAKGRGLAKKLFSEILKIAKEHKLIHISLYSTKTAKTFYESLGFYQNAGDTTIEMQGIPIPCYPMELSLQNL